MKIKPYTGAPSLEAAMRSIFEALMGKLTLRDNAAAVAVSVEWLDGPVSIPSAFVPRSVVLLRAQRLDNPSLWRSGGSVSWSPQPDGGILVTSLDLTSSVSWAVDLLLVED
jgi:hypothetical protein